MLLFPRLPSMVRWMGFLAKKGGILAPSDSSIKVPLSVRELSEHSPSLMETTVPRAAKSSLNAIFRISDLCKVISVGAPPVSLKPKSNKPKDPAFSEEAAILLKLLDSISSLKLAYVQLQQAHIPYDPNKINSSDKLITSQLESLSKLENLYKEKLIDKPKSQTSVSLKIKEHEKLLVVLQSIVQDKESEIERLRLAIHKLERENSELNENVKKNPSCGRRLNVVNRELTPNLFAEVVSFASRSLHDFTKPLISLMQVSGWDLDSAVRCMYTGTVFHERSHKKYAFEAYLSRVMLSGVQEEFISIHHFDLVMGILDPFEVLISNPNSDFSIFCREKYLDAIPKEMEDSFFGNLDHRAFLMSGGHPRTPFYKAFVKMAKWVWALKVMSLTFIPKAEIFYVREMDWFNNDFMESVVAELTPKREQMSKVGFTVMPGFKIGENVIRCRVYLSKS
ncbi:IRK-interacting protein [Carex littledalei]|uniref:IRK-interacting protein n=1 Tax=Carex littledalei TaxID=544730 RepID=A0A833VFU9_9POAL|nr:IRK-interacting protein [Carex littledalei]